MPDNQTVPSAMLTIFINGRFLGRQPTGVDRFAIELIRAIDELCTNCDPSVDGLTFQILVPRGINPSQDLHNIPTRHVGHLQGQAWEQIDLPLAAGGGLLLNLCNTAPIFRQKQLVVIHDAATARVPSSYGKLFRLWYGLLIPTVYRRAASVCTVSKFSRDDLAQVYGTREHVRVVPEGTDHMARVSSDQGVLDRHGLRSRPYIFAVSSLSSHKNFGAVVTAVELMGSTDFDIAIAGGQNPKIFAQVGQNLPASVKYVGYVSDAELKALYENASCFVFPSLYEGYGLPPTEAMACGCPVVAANAASLPEVCGDAAAYFDPREPADLARTLDSVMRSPSQRLQMKSLGLTQTKTMVWSSAALTLLSEIRRVA